jgi:fructoselysine-6-P-deglycase FrlB-like protein
VIADTQLWADARGLGGALQAGLDAADGHADLAHLLGGARRVVATGNGASYYAALALWLASLHAPAAGAPDVLAIPGGLVAGGRFAWRAGDVLLAFSSSGEFRDVIEAVDDAPRPFGLVSATPDSTLGRSAGALARTVVTRQAGATHTQAYCGAVLTALAVWARVTGDGTLDRAVTQAPARSAESLVAAARWAQSLALDAPPSAAVAFGSGPAWAAALEAALLIKEVALVPCEGVETREGATTAMYALGPGQLALGVPAYGADALLDEAEDVCRGRGADVLRLPGLDGDPRLAAVTSFPAALAFAIALARARDVDPDDPPWKDAYLATARSLEPDDRPADGR